MLPLENAPAARHGHALAWLAGTAFVFGGTASDGTLLTDAVSFVP
jgi:hypothetical protein